MNHNKPALLILHPLFLSGSDLKKLGIFQSLERNYHVIYPDLAAHGTNKQIPFTTINAAIKQLISDIEKDGSQRPFRGALGFSLGARILLEASKLEPERFGIPILDGIPLVDETTKRLKKNLKEVKLLRSMSRYSPSLLKALLAKTYGDQIATIMLNNIRSFDAKSLENIVRECTSELPNLQKAHWETCQFMFGDKEQDYRFSSTLLAKYPDIKISVFKGYDHIEFCAKETNQYCSLINEILTNELE